MKFFVFTLEPRGSALPRHARPSMVNAQPMREILSMMIVQNGRILLALPTAEGAAHPAQAQPGFFSLHLYVLSRKPARGDVVDRHEH